MVWTHNLKTCLKMDLSSNSEAKHLLFRFAVQRWSEWKCVTQHNPSDCVLCPGWYHCFMDLLMAGFQHNLLCHICSSSSHLFFFPGSSPLIWLCLFPFFHCFNASCQIECLWDSFLDFRALEALFFVVFFCNPASALFPPQLSSLSSLFFFLFLLRL